MLGLALGLRQHLVRDRLDDVLQEGVLAAFRRAGIGLHRDDLLAEQRGEERLQLLGIAPAERRQSELVERLAEHGGVLDDAPLLCAEPVEPCRDKSLKRLGHLERLDHAGRPVDMPFLDEEAAVEQHPHGLDRVQRHPLGPGEDARPEILGQPGHEAGQQVAHRLLRERLEVERAEAALAGAPGRPAIGEFGPGEAEHEERMAARPLEQVFEKVEQPRVGPLQILEHENRRRLLGQPLEQDPPGGEEVLLVAGHAFLQAE